MLKIKKLQKIGFLLLFLSSCSPSSNDTFNASSLIDPEYEFSSYLLYCNLKDDSLLINLESFLLNYSKNNKDHNLEILLPNNQNIKDFILILNESVNQNSFQDFIKSLSENNFDRIAECTFDTDKLNGLTILKLEQTDIENSKNISEVLKCQYNSNYNYGTFKLTLDKFKNYTKSLKINYESLYLEPNDHLQYFIWINKFNSDNYVNEILNNWINTSESKSIKDEFLENASCIESNYYNSFELN